MLNKLSVLLRLTETELKVLIFLVAAFLFGYGYKIFFHQSDETKVKVFDYSKEDSLFFASGNEENMHPESGNQEVRSVDYKHEVLDFNNNDFVRNIAEITPSEKSINLNSAKIEELTLLPGIGLKTAERIIEFRNKRGGFNSLNELRDIKGIGETKFNNIIKYLYID